MGTLSFTHLLLVALILLLFFGPSKLPQLGQSLGRAIRGFKEGMNELDGEARDLSAKNTQENQQLNHDQQTRPVQQKQHETSDTNKKS
jgi:sec-independent protein translocase protein TatA